MVEIGARFPGFALSWCDLSLSLLLEKLPAIIFQPDPAILAKHFLEVKEHLSSITENAMSDLETLLVLIKNAPPHFLRTPIRQGVQ